MRHRGYNVCPECGESYDCGERHVCEGPPPPKVAAPRVDKHLEACRRMGQYVQPGCKLEKREGRRIALDGAATGQKQVKGKALSGILAAQPRSQGVMRPT